MRLLTRPRPLSTSSYLHRSTLPAGLRRGVILPGVLVLALGGGLSACSGDSDDGEGSGDSSSESADGAGTDEAADEEEFQSPGAQIGTCEAEVEVSGDAQATWTGKATVRTPGAEDTGGGPSAAYVAEKGKNLLSIYSAGEDFAGPAVTFTSGKQTYASDPADEEAMIVEEDGTQATIGLDLRGLDEKSVTMDASFVCGDLLKRQNGGGKRGNQNRG